MDLENVVTGIDRTQRRFAPVLDDLANLARIELVRDGRAIAGRQRARRDRRPRRFPVLRILLVQRPITCPRLATRALASGVPDLNRGDRALAANEVIDAAVLRDVTVCVNGRAV